MKRRRHWTLWAGLASLLAGIFSYPLLVQFPITRNYSWANLLLLLAGVILLALGTVHAFREPTLYRGKILGSILTTLSVAATAIFAFGIFYLARIPAPAAAPRLASTIPDLTLTDENGRPVTQADLLASTSQTGPPAKGALLIFYRGHW